MAKAKNIGAQDEKAHDDDWRNDHAERWAALERKGWLLSSPEMDGERVRMKIVMGGTMGKLAHTVDVPKTNDAALVEACEAFDATEAGNRNARRGEANQ